jgi:hypothetical protein
VGRNYKKEDLIFLYFKYFSKTLIILWFFLLLCWVGIHCGIYKSSYNISNLSYLNSPCPPFSFISLSPHSWKSFNRSYFSIYIHVYTVCALYSFFYILSPPFPHSHWYQCPRQDLFCPPVLQFCKRKIMTFLFA